SLSLSVLFVLDLSLSLSFYVSIFLLILVSIWPMDRLGFYFVAFSAAGAGFAMVSQAIGLTLLPSLAGVEQVQRRDRLERILRYTILAALGFAALIIVTAPFVIPLIFGEAFRPAVAYTQGLALALLFVPIRSVILEANRSAGKGRPGIEMALASLAVFITIYLLTGFASAGHLFLAIGAGNVAAIAMGLRHPVAAGDIRLLHGLVPRPADAFFLMREARNHLPVSLRRSP
ncbi:MAG: oligosaccharide flippase family protein, partial [Pseudomonadota bacterium]